MTIEEDEEEFELNNAIEGAQMENPHEVHCTCVSLLKMRIKELEEEVKKYKIS